MSLIGNIIWLIFGGLPAAIGYFVGGLALCLTVVGIPFGLVSLRMAGAVLTPFGRTVVPTSRGQGCLATFFNILWLLIFGWGIALAHITGGLILAITIVGLPFARQHFKLVPVALFPFSYELK
jgi:uncharacterized membrane protein YccF (DUF307 family)